MDGYLLMATSSGQIRNTYINSITSWPILGFITADTFGSPLEAIYQQKDQIVALTKNRVEFYFNNGNPVGSPLLRIDQNTVYVGLASRETLAWYGENCMFVGDASEGGRAVYQIASMKMADVSTPVINRFLLNEGMSISSCTAWMAPVNGQLIYCLNLVSSNRSFVYGQDTKLWSEWTTPTGNRFNCVSAVYLNGITYLQDVSSGQIHKMSPTIYQDNASSFTVQLQTERSNFGVYRRKTEKSVSLVGDSITGQVGVEVSDNDYSSWVSSGTIDMSLQQKKLTRLGAFYERAHRFSYTANSSFRVQGYAPEL